MSGSNTFTHVSAGQHVYGDPHLRGFPGTKVLKGTLHYVGHSHSSLRGIVVKTEAHRLKITWLNSLAGGPIVLLWTASIGLVYSHAEICTISAVISQ